MESMVPSQGQSATNPSKETYGSDQDCFRNNIMSQNNSKKDLFNVVEMGQFNNTSDQFQAELKNDIDNIKQCPDILVFANKKSNIYKINPKTAKTTKVTNKGNVR